MNSGVMKARILKYLRFDRQMHMVCTEVGMFSSDVGAITKSNQLLEIEVKCTLADFKADKLKEKHSMYLNESKEKFFKPHFFYYAVPSDLINKVALLINPKYGLIKVNETYPYIVLVKKPALLRKSPVNEEETRKFIMRMASDLVNRYIDINIKGK